MLDPSQKDSPVYINSIRDNLLADNTSVRKSYINPFSLFFGALGSCLLLYEFLKNKIKK